MKNFILALALLTVSFASKAEPVVPFVENVSVSYDHSFDFQRFFASPIKSVTGSYVGGSSSLNQYVVTVWPVETVSTQYYLSVTTNGNYGQQTIDIEVDVLAGHYQGATQVNQGLYQVYNVVSYSIEYIYP